MKVLTLTEVAAFMNVSEKTTSLWLRKEMKRGLRVIKVGREYRVSQEVLERYLTKKPKKS